MDPVSPDIFDTNTWIQIGLLGLIVTIAITVLKQLLRSHSVGRRVLASTWIKPVMVVLPYVIAITAVLTPTGIIPVEIPRGMKILLGVVAAHFSERLYKAFSRTIPGVALPTSVQREDDVH